MLPATEPPAAVGIAHFLNEQALCKMKKKKKSIIIPLENMHEIALNNQATIKSVHQERSYFFNSSFPPF